jgi:predicted transposase/invertase (TIGR01784 family)
MDKLLCFSSAMSSEPVPEAIVDESTSHDQSFKELISTFFIEFLELFLPEMAATIDPTSIKFLQQEYFTDLVEGETKIVDLLAEVNQAGEDATFLVHIEPQSTSRSVFPQRMFFYFSRLHQKHLKRIYPIAIFSYDEPYKEAENRYVVEFPDRKVLDFDFMAIQLNRLDWRDFLDRPNPVAAALMAKMKIAKPDRPKVKAECLRLLVTLKLDPAKTRLISKFVDSYLRLDVKEERTFQAEIDTMGLEQKEAIMQATTSWEETGIEKGQRSLISLLLEQKVGELPDRISDRVTQLSPDRLQALAIALLHFESIDDLTAWLENHE